jgi:hypothetical protein
MEEYLTGCNTVEDTGYQAWVLIYLWNAYSQVLVEMTPEDLYTVFVYIHLYPTHRQARRVLRQSKSYVTRTLLPTMHKLAALMHEVDWNQRLDPFNHTTLFPPCFTGYFSKFYLFGRNCRYISYLCLSTKIP